LGTRVSGRGAAAGRDDSGHGTKPASADQNAISFRF
jgi:hypothetical protein